MLPDGLAVPEVVVLRDERVDQRLLLGPPHLPQHDRAELARAALDRRRIDPFGLATGEQHLQLVREELLLHPTLYALIPPP